MEKKLSVDRLESRYQYHITGMKLMQWIAGKGIMPEDEDACEWRSSLEVTIGEGDDLLSKLIIDCGFGLMDKKDKALTLIKVRCFYGLTRYPNNQIPAEVLAVFLDKSITNARAICAEKALESSVYLPIIPIFTFARLTDIASLMLYKPSVSSFIHERTNTRRNITIEGINQEKLDFILTQSVVNWFYPIGNEHPDAILANLTLEPGTVRVEINFGFDYERKDGKWLLHLDFGLKIMPVAAIRTRCGFLVGATEEALYVMPVFKELVTVSWNEMMTFLKDKITENKIGFKGEIKLSDASYDSFAHSCIDKYFKALKVDEERNKFLYEQGLRLTVGGNTILIVTATFMIIDEILFLNPAFDHQHNLGLIKEAQFNDLQYYTTRNNCLALEYGEVNLIWKDTFVFYLCLDLALQMLMGDQGEKLQPALQRQNLTLFRQKEFIKFGDGMFKQLNDAMKESGGRITNLENRINWMERIK